ncbi:Uma2 family endonuclease [Streptomyces indicus]|uniref:Endonuclease, Uma2 family (Restriction endonuclease fold) n=1 Tax=Streptomyces indicus TaxID=417292 RepID=A0A1G9CEN1_9ACTN|nr:Uma2 family endonuclease [Streptomyces indicus]SDK50109.1 Endonuclease, Uma2 family (restriction endonuclease fold) [Streptomyces indicus]
MTLMAERTSQMSVEEFEEIASTAPETVTLEFIGGRLEVKRVADGDHGTIIMWLLRQCMQARPDMDLDPNQGLKVGRYRNGRARPDGSLAPVAHFAGQGDWADPEGVLMAAEVTSYDSDTNRRDREEKPDAYGAAGIPVYLLIDRDQGAVVVHTNPDTDLGGYRDRHTALLGEEVTLPDPVGITLDTEILKNYVR